MPRGTRPALALAVATAALTAGGCGTSSHPNNLRPATPLSVTAQITNRQVSVSPHRFGAGLVVIAISNQADTPQSLVVEGEGVSRSSGLLEAGAVGELKVDLKTGVFTATAGANSKAKPATLDVGAPRPSAQDKLLEP